jgi:hypothetical protein
MRAIRPRGSEGVEVLSGWARAPIRPGQSESPGGWPGLSGGSEWRAVQESKRWIPQQIHQGLRSLPHRFTGKGWLPRRRFALPGTFPARLVPSLRPQEGWPRSPPSAATCLKRGGSSRMGCAPSRPRTCTRACGWCMATQGASGGPADASLEATAAETEKRAAPSPGPPVHNRSDRLHHSESGVRRPGAGTPVSDHSTSSSLMKGRMKSRTGLTSTRWAHSRAMPDQPMSPRLDTAMILPSRKCGPPESP